MHTDPLAFSRAYLADRPLPVALPGGWRLVALADGRTRLSVDLVLEAPDGRRAIAYAEHRAPGMQALACTRELALSYYTPEPPADEHALATAVRALAALFAEAEARHEGLAAPAFAPAGATAPASHPVELRINRECNERCLFCNTPPESRDILDDPARILAEIARLAALGHREITFTGREPTLDPSLPHYIACARAGGFTRVRLQTNGTTLAHAPLLARLRDAGLDRVDLSLHTLRPEVFEELVGPARLLEKALEGLRNVLREPALEAQVLCVVTAATVEELPEIVRRLAGEAGHRAIDVVLSPVAPQGWGAARQELMVPLGALREALRRAHEAARGTSVALAIPRRCGVPVCVTPPELRERNLALHSAAGDNIETGKRRAPRCEGCGLAERCAGYWGAYLDRHGDAELQPLPPQRQ